jgi:alkanesulfonate monooxygenase SsuD/methylene tetrahydromethanopterin reductase-like flavin-dependent oxidoreductase (luciferase family)
VEARYAVARAAARPYTAEDHGSPVRTRVAAITAQYPLERMHQIETIEEEKRAQLEAERQAALRAPEYYLQAAIFGDADAAAAMLTELIDSGHDGTLVAAESASGVLYEIRLGPYETLEDARAADGVVRRSHGLTPQLLVVQPPGPEGEQ